MSIIAKGDDISDGDAGPGGEAEFDDDPFVGFHDARFLPLTLSAWSRAQGAFRVVELAGEEAARVADGRTQPPGLFPADAIAETFWADDGRARAIFTK